MFVLRKPPGLTASEFEDLQRHVESELGRIYWIVDKFAHDPKADRAGEQDHLKRIPDDWLATPGIDAFGFYITFSNFCATMLG